MLSARLLHQLGRATFKRAERGLFGGKHIQYGNNNPFSKKKTRRRWLPNVQNKRLYSETFNKFFGLKVTTAVLRTMDKKGGLDRYLLETKEKNLFSEKGVQMKRNLIAEINRKIIIGESSPETETEIPFGETEMPKLEGGEGEPIFSLSEMPKLGGEEGEVIFSLPEGETKILKLESGEGEASKSEDEKAKSEGGESEGKA